MADTVNLGDNVYLTSLLMNMHCYGEVSDIDTPPSVTGTLELAGREAVLSIPVLQGKQGDKGEPADIVKLQYGHGFTDPAQLPTLTNTPEDIGTAYWIDNLVYVWTGTDYDVYQMGSPGPTGKTPDITVSVESISWEDQQAGAESEVVEGGTVDDPTLHFKIAAPRGPVGPSTNITGAPDYDNTVPPTVGQVVTWTGTKWAPVDPNPYATKMYTIPESAFQGLPISVGTKVIACTFEIPVQPQDFNLWISGHLRVRGIELDFDPFAITSEVRVSTANQDPKSGVLIGRGFGSNAGLMFLQPHASTPASPGDAIGPENGAYGRFAANTTHNMSVIIATSGPLGVYNFQPQDAQLAFQVIPV